LGDLPLASMMALLIGPFIVQDSDFARAQANSECSVNILLNLSLFTESFALLSSGFAFFLFFHLIVCGQLNLGNSQAVEIVANSHFHHRTKLRNGGSGSV